MRLLVTRPEPDGEQTAAALRARGHAALISPLLRIEAIADADLGAGPWAGLILTSSNAARAIARHPRCGELADLPVFTVGRRTAAAARRAGFSRIVSADGGADDLVRMILLQRGGTGGLLLHLAGEDRAADVAGALRAQDVRTDTAIVYRAAAATELPPPMRQALAAGELDGVLHFSRRSAEIYVNCARRAGLLDRALVPSHYCLSRQVAEPLLAAGARKVAVAAQPTEAALLDLVGP